MEMKASCERGEKKRADVEGVFHLEMKGADGGASRF